MDYQKVYTSLISKRTAIPLKKSKELYTELHHILPRCLGGSDEPENLVRLTAREHFIAHRLLSKIYRGNFDLSFSVLMMAETSRGKVNSSREIERLRRLASQASSGRLTRLWEEKEFRNNMIEALRVSTTNRWNDPTDLLNSPECRTKMSHELKKAWADPESSYNTPKFREMLKKRMNDPRVKGFMSEVATRNWVRVDSPYKTQEVTQKKSIRLKQLHADRNSKYNSEEYKNKCKERLAQQRADPGSSINSKETRKKISDGVRGTYNERYPMPWMHPTSSEECKYLWTLADWFFEVSKFNTDRDGSSPAIGYTKFCKLYADNKHIRVFWKMEQLFKGGWNPRKCDLWLSSFFDQQLRC